MYVQTVTGPIGLDQLGRTLMHEHLFIAFAGSEFDPSVTFDRPGFVAEAVRRLTRLRVEHGVRTFVDPCPIELGRDAALMKEIAEKSEMHLPCGGGLDLLIVPDPDSETVASALALLDQRRTIEIVTGLDGTFRTSPAKAVRRAEWDGHVLSLRIDPVLRIVAIGQGEEVVALSRQALAYGADVTALTPDAAAINLLASIGAKAHHLLTPAPSSLLETDPTTAVVFLFHDHDWEQALLRQALDQPALLIGAMGSRRTQALRLEALHGAGVPAAQRARIEGPIGLIPMTRDPDTLALSVLAQVAAAYQAHCDRLCNPAGNCTLIDALGNLNAF